MEGTPDPSLWGLFIVASMVLLLTQGPAVLYIPARSSRGETPGRSQCSASISTPIVHINKSTSDRGTCPLRLPGMAQERASRAQFPLTGIVAIAPMAWTRRWLLRDVDLARREEPEGAEAPREAAFRVLSGVRSIACAPAAPDPGNPAPRRGIVLAASAAPCRQAGAGARGQDRTARRMAMASRIRQGVRPADFLPHAASALS